MPELSPTVMYEGVEIDPREILDRYIASPYGQYHCEQRTRFAQENGYFYGTREDFISDLGQDVHPVGHMLYTHDNVTVPFLVAQRPEATFTLEEEAVLRVTAVMHDFGENGHPAIAEAVGCEPGEDVKWGTHIEGQKDAELIRRNFIYDQLFPDIPKQLLYQVDQVDAGHGGLGRAFNIIERLGYFMTAMIARDIAYVADKDFHVMNPDEQKRVSQLARLALAVDYSQRGVLHSVRNEYKFVDHILELNGFSK